MKINRLRKTPKHRPQKTFVEQPASGDGATDNGEDQSAENSSEEAATDSNPGTEEVAQAAENSEETKQDIEEENPGCRK
jgi:nucleosome binding factor SPN SPT16 subunit